jgi:calcium-binding protein CML
MASKLLSKEQLAELKDIFSRFDRDRDGSVTVLELSSLLRSLGLKPASAEAFEELIGKADENKNGLIEFEEFANLIAPEMFKEDVRYSEEEIMALFKAFDRDGNGYITAVELAQSMARLGHTLTVNELADMIREADVDGDGRISYKEFAAAISNAALENSAFAPHAS